MKTSSKFASAALAAMTLGSSVFATGAMADAQKQKNDWRNIGAGAAAITLYGLKNHNTLTTIIGAAGTAYSAQQYEKNRKAEDAQARQHQQNYYRRYHRYDSTAPAAGYTTDNSSTSYHRYNPNNNGTGNYVNRSQGYGTYGNRTPGSVTYYSTTPIAVNVDGQAVAFNGVRPMQRNGSVLVPLRGVFEAMGATVDFDNATKTIIAEKNNRFVRLPLGSTVANVNGQATNLSQPARVVNGSTLVPLRFVAESLGSTVNWSANTSTVSIMTDPNGGPNATNTNMNGR